MHCVADLVVCLGNFSGHVLRHIGGYNGVCGVFGVELNAQRTISLLKDKIRKRFEDGLI